MRFSFNLALAIAPVLFVVGGCSEKKTGELSAADLQAFDQAPAEVKKAWEVALAADKTNDYAAAFYDCYALLRNDLQPGQQQAVTHELTAVKQRLDDACQKGDPAAQKAMEELRRVPPNRPH